MTRTRKRPHPAGARLKSTIHPRRLTREKVKAQTDVVRLRKKISTVLDRQANPQADVPPQANADVPEWMSPHELARKLKKNPVTIYRWVRRGLIKYKRYGKTIVVQL